jgi:hypothetical protein
VPDRPASLQGTTDLETLTQVANVDPVSPRQLQPAVPRDLETICLKCLHKEPGQRYTSALAEDLARFQAGQPSQARPVGAPERAWRWCRRNPAIAALAGLATLLLIVHAGGASVGNVILSERLRRLEEAEKDKRLRLFDSLLAQARASRMTHRPGQRSARAALPTDE